MRNKTVLTLSLAAAMAAGVAVANEKVTVLPWSLEYSGYLTNVSHNGNWAVGMPRAGETFTKTQIIDVHKGKVVDLPVEKWYTSKGAERVPNGGAVVTGGVSEDGKIVCGTYNDQPAYWKDNAWYLLPFPNGRGEEFREYTSAFVTNVRGDGKYYIGYAYNQAYDIKPMLWIDGVLQTLPGLPDRDWKGHSMEDRYDAEGNNIGPEANMRFCDITEDGKYLLGGMSTNHPGWGCSFFIYDMEKATFKFIGISELNELIGSGEYFEETEVMSDIMPQLSADGKYVVGNVNLVENVGTQFPVEHKVPFIYTISTDKMEILQNKVNENVGVCAIDKNGTLVGMSSIDSPSRSVLFHRDGIWYTLESILEQVYDVNWNVATGYTDLSGSPYGISWDGKTVVCMEPGSDKTSYMVSLADQTFGEAAAKVNMLKNYEVFPAAGAEIARFDNIMIRFERGVEYKDLKATITDQDGNVVAESSSVGMPKGVTDARYKQVNFPETKFDNRKIYTITFPAGMFVMEGSKMLSPEVQVKYRGRKEQPVAPIEISPKDNSPVIELGVNNMATVTFDCPIQVSSKYNAQLYVDNSPTALCPLNMTYSGNTVYIYPTVSRKLRFGNNYTIKVDAGAVLDLTGYCPSEAFEIHYEGIYTPKGGESVLFNDDFNEPGESLNKWLLYEGDHNEPNASVTGFGFDKDNTPWNFSVRDAENYDYAAASSSMFANPGKADDWMVTPQLNVKNDYYWLDFDAQSYKKDKQDYLKVIAWPCDETYGSVDKTIIDRIRKEGTVLINDRQVPGLNEETLSGEWKHYRISLKDFAGKQIYIAFVNENENQSMVFVDNVNIEFTGNYMAGISESEYAVNVDKQNISGFVTVTNSGVTYTSLKATLFDSEGNKVSTFSKDGLNLQKEDTYHFSFPEPLALKKGEINEYKVIAEMGNESQTVVSRIHNLMFQPERRVVIEEGTGTWCGNCPAGFVAIEDLENKFGESVIPVSVHNNDVMANEAYISFLGFGAFPQARVNRNDDYLTPTVVDPATGLRTFVSQTGNETFHDQVLKELEKPALAEISIESAKLLTQNKIEVEAKVNFALNAKDIYYNVLTVLLEDNIMALQTNYFAGNSDPIYGDFGQGGKYDAAHCFMNFVDVARGIAGGSYYGDGSFIPQTVEANNPYTANISMTLPKTVNDSQQCKVVTMLVDAVTGRILNAARMALDTSGVEGVSSEQTKAIFSVGNDSSILLNGTTDGVHVFTLDGRRVENKNLATGLYIARGMAGSKTTTAKIMIRK